MSKSKITEEEEAINEGPRFKVGDIVKFTDGSDTVIIMVTDPETCSAVVLTSDLLHVIGDHGPAWNFDEFELFKGKITLYND